MAADVAYEVDAHASRTLVVEVAIQAERAQVSLELFAEEGSRLAAAGVAGLLAAEENEVFVGTGAGDEG